MMYYYFVSKSGGKYVKVTDYEINTDINRNYEELSPEQVAFYEENPTASVLEVYKCRLNDVEMAYDLSLDDYKILKLKEVSDISLQTLGKHVSDYNVINAMLSLESDDDDKIYDDVKSNSYISTYLRVGKQCRELFYKYKLYIISADSQENVDSIIEQAQKDYAEID